MSGRRHDLVEIVPAGPKAAAQAEAVRTRLLNQVDERRHPRTSATVDQLLDRHFEMATLEPTTLATYVGYATKHIRPLIGQLQVGALDADVFDSFYAELRRCRDHCDRPRAASTTGPPPSTSATRAAGRTAARRSARRRSGRSTSSSAAP